MLFEFALALAPLAELIELGEGPALFVVESGACFGVHAATQTTIQVVRSRRARVDFKSLPLRATTHPAAIVPAELR